MDWLKALVFLNSTGVAHSALVLCLVSGLGLLLGRIRIHGFQLGIAGVLFAGLFFGHCGINLEPAVLDFAREFGLILFVFAIGMQVGPGFVASLRHRGLRLAGLATAVALLGALVALALHFFAGESIPVVVGLLAGGTTNTPCLGAAQQALKDVPGLSPAALQQPDLGCAITYPFGVIGTIMVMALVRKLFAIDVKTEHRALEYSQISKRAPLNTLNVEVQNANLDGLPLKKIPVLSTSGVVISRMWHDGKICVPRGETTVHSGDVLLAVGPAAKLEEFRMVVGRASELDLRAEPSGIAAERVVVTRPEVLGKSIQELDLAGHYGVTVTRVSRAEIEFTPTPDLHLQFADTVLLVGEKDDLDHATQAFGNSPKDLNYPMLAPIFLGITCGVLAGSWPIAVPGLPVAVKLGLAAGPMLAGILFSRLSRIGPLIWFMPIAANYMLREFGIVLFLGCVGLKAGDHFVDTLLRGDGTLWLLYGAIITLVPLLIVSLLARWLMKINFVTLCGVLAGSMTNPPALVYANALAGSDAPAISYATVYPVTMLLRVLSAQLIVVIFAR